MVCGKLRHFAAGTADNQEASTPGNGAGCGDRQLSANGVEYDIAAPARRALVDAKLYKVSDLRKISLAELEGLHGMGKSAVARLKVLMNAKKIKFRP